MNKTSTIVKNASEAGKTAAKQGGLLPESLIVIAGVGLMTVLVAAAIYMYFSDKRYGYLSRFISWISGKLSAEEKKERSRSDEEMEETVEKAVENDITETSSKEELWRAVQSIAEESEHIGRMEERRKKEEKNDIEQMVQFNLLLTGLLVLKMAATALGWA
ncbi:MAG: hypothetical protein ABEJ83_02910 [Candidatus Nanohaloarchaea archaeon]